MKDPKVQKALESILPSNEQKEKMLNNIKHKKSNKHLLRYALILTVASFSIIIYNNTNNNVVEPINRSLNIYYNDTCYEEYKDYKGSINKLTEIDESILPGGHAYKIKNSNSIVIYLDKYIEFRKCEEK